MKTSEFIKVLQMHMSKYGDTEIIVSAVDKRFMDYDDLFIFQTEENATSIISACYIDDKNLRPIEKYCGGGEGGFYIKNDLDFDWGPEIDHARCERMRESGVSEDYIQQSVKHYLPPKGGEGDHLSKLKRVKERI